MPLERETKYYAAQHEKLLQHSEGKYVLIIGEELLGSFDTAEKAYEKGVQLRGDVPMLVRQVVRDEPTETSPAMVLGLIHVCT